MKQQILEDLEELRIKLNQEIKNTYENKLKMYFDEMKRTGIEEFSIIEDYLSLPYLLLDLNDFKLDTYFPQIVNKRKQHDTTLRKIIDKFETNDGYKQFNKIFNEWRTFVRSIGDYINKQSKVFMQEQLMKVNKAKEEKTQNQEQKEIEDLESLIDNI